MKLFTRALCLILCIVLLAGACSAYAADLSDLPGELSGILDSIDLDDLDLDELTDALENFLEDNRTLDLRDMTDEIRDRAEDYGLDLSEKQVDQLIDALEGLEKTGSARFRRQVRTGQRIYKAITSVRNFFRNIKNLFRRTVRIFG